MLNMMTKFASRSGDVRRRGCSIVLGTVLLFGISRFPEAQEIVIVRDYNTLKEGYQAQDTEGKRLELEKERAALELQKYAVENGIHFTVSSGEGVFTFAPSGVSFSSAPGAEFSFPNLRNTGVSLDAPLATDGKNITSYGVDVSVKTGIVTRQGDTYTAGLELSRRNFLSALRNAESRRRTAEQEFCELIKKLLATENDILTAQVKVLEARNDLEVKQAGGYSASSTVWRTAELSLRTRERELGEVQRKQERALRDFAESCAVPGAGIPGNIPDEALLSITDFDPEAYTVLEEARWNYGVHSLQRRSLDGPFTLDGRAGYSWRGGGGGSGSYADAAGSRATAGLDFSRGGLSLSAGVSVPFEHPGEPSLTFMFQWKPSGSKTSKIDRQLRDIAARGEQLTITGAEKKYRDLVIDYEDKRGELLWQQETYAEEADLYRVNAEDQRRWLDQGIIKETDYLDARTNYLMALNRALSARIDRLLYNLELAGLFVDDTTLNNAAGSAGSDSANSDSTNSNSTDGN
jgi:hypothetical protein